MPFPPPKPHSKTTLRRTLRARRNALSPAQRDEFSVLICAHLKSWLLLSNDSISRVATYQALPREVDLSALLELNFDFVVPRRVENRWIDADEDAVFVGLDRSQVLAPSQIEAILVPGVAFDARGHRIGQGGGWYDRVLSRAPHALKIGVAFSCQIVESLPHEAHDVAMDGIVTENGWYWCGRDLCGRDLCGRENE